MIIDHSSKVLERVGRVNNVSQNPPTFAEMVKGKENSSLRRSNDLHFKTKADLQQHEVIDLLKEMKFECEKLEKIVEIKNKKIDITCKNRKYLLELYEQLKSNDNVYEVQLYEPDNVNAILDGFRSLFQTRHFNIVLRRKFLERLLTFQKKNYRSLNFWNSNPCFE